MEALNKLASKVGLGAKKNTPEQQQREEREGAFDATGVHDEAPAALRSSAWRALVEGAPAWPGVREFEAPAGSRSLPWKSDSVCLCCSNTTVAHEIPVVANSIHA